MIDQRQRAGMMIVAFSYILGWGIGRAGGRASVIREMLQAHASGTRRT